jgi:hypothetical protein
MGFLRRLTDSLRGPTSPDAPPSRDAPGTSADRDDDPDASERAYELDLLREDQARIDELGQRQLRYAAHAWQPPAQGGTVRADDKDSDAD